MSSQSSISRRARQGTVLLALLATGCASLLTACGSAKPGNAASAALASVVVSGSWRVQKSPNAGGASNDNALLGVAATSASDAWAVGSYANGTAARTLVERWNGAAWTVQDSPNPGGASNSHLLDGVAATSATNAWAVGAYDTAGRTLVEHWNGTAWTVQNSPNPGGANGKNFLFGVSATSATNAWAVGYYDKGTVDRTLIEHWNGTAWTVQPSPNTGSPSQDNDLHAVAATSASNAFAVGSYSTSNAGRTLIEHRS